MRNQLFNTLAILLVLGISSGCRTYGGHGSEQASYDQIATINTRFAQDLERAKGELQGLTQAAGSDADLKMALKQYESLLGLHEEMVAEHAELAGTLVVKPGAIGRLGTSYRDLNRALGYITAEQLGMKNDYVSFASSLLKNDDQRAAVQEEESRYEIAPPYYERIRFALAKRSVSDALRVRAGT